MGWLERNGLTAHNSAVREILPVSGSVVRERTRSFTVNLMAFSGATPCGKEESTLATQPDGAEWMSNGPKAEEEDLDKSLGSLR